MDNSESKALYLNSKGAEVTHGSYSARQTFKHCPRAFELQRVQGWSDRTQRAAPLFGTALESAVKEFEANGRPPGTIAAAFERIWQQVKTTPNFEKLIYTDTEESWESLLRCGREMCQLYEIRVPYLPISIQPPAVWSQSLRKKIFPGTELDKLENKAVYDILSFPAWNHPMLPPIEKPERELTRTLVIDMKTGSGDLNTELVGLDPQLAEYAWQGRVPDVAFLWFVKKGHDVRKGSRVTLLQKPDKCDYSPGFELNVLWISSAKEATAKKPATEEKIYLGTNAVMVEYEQQAKGITGAALETFKGTFAERPDVYLCPREFYTKQRLQFAAVRLTEQQMEDTGRSVAQTTIEMVRAHREGFYPQMAGVRFPNEKCGFCAMRWICLNKPDKRDQTLTKRGEEWLDGKQDTELDGE